MKILIVSSWGKTAFELGGYCKNAFAEIGHNADLFTYNDERISSRFPFLRNLERRLVGKALIKKISDFRPQLILVIKGDRIPLELIRELKEIFRIPVANYWIDDPDSIEISQKISPTYDYFFTNDPDAVQVHKESGCPRVKFLSFGFLPQLHKKIQLSEEEYKRYGNDVCFAGTVSEGRIKVLEELSGFNLKVWSPRFVYSFKEKSRIKINKLPSSSTLYSKFTGSAVWNEELVKVYNASKIVLNIHSPQTVPIMRDFEVTGCGAFLMTDHARSLETMFNPGQEIICYKNVENLKDLVKFYLSHSPEREEIARKGNLRAHRDHTYARRMEELISFIEKEKT
jgi:spore maturation protein CgeB